MKNIGMKRNCVREFYDDYLSTEYLISAEANLPKRPRYHDIEEELFLGTDLFAMEPSKRSYEYEETPLVVDDEFQLKEKDPIVNSAE